MKKTRSTLINVVAVLLLAALLAAGVCFANRAKKKEYNQYYTINYVLVRVEKVLYESYTVDDDSEHALRGSQSLSVRVLTGRHKGDVMPVTNYLGPMHEKLAKQGTVLTVTLTEDSRETGYQISVVNYDFTWLLIIMLVLFAAAVIVVGRRKGLMSLIGVAVTIAALVFFLFGFLSCIKEF